MARVFPEDSPSLDPNNIEESMDKIERYLRYMQERIEHMNFSQGKVEERQAEEIGQVVSRDGNSVNIIGNSIVEAINDSGTTVAISADKITLSGDVVVKSMLTDGSTQISGSNITTGTINAARIDTSSLYINGQNVQGAVAEATAATSAATAAVAATANALNTAVANFASIMRGYVNTAMATATSSANAITIADLPMYKDTYNNVATLKIDFGGSNYHVRFCPGGITLGSYRYYLILNTPAGEFGIRTPSGGTTLSLGYTD